tara:strand:+ start:791 stop:3598 length:2808 start_codon:yes stop_codon:yes gene_type:complete
MSQLRLNIDKYFPGIIFFGLSLILFMPLVVSPETVFPYVVGKSFWFKGITYFIAGFYLILLSANRSYFPDKNFLILIFSIFVLIQALAALAGSSPVNSFWSNWERMEGVTDYFHWLLLIIVSSSVLRNEKSWIKLLKINVFAGFTVSFLGLLEFFDLVIPILFGLDIFPSVVNPEQSYTLGERVESTIGNPAYLASYLSIISFVSIGLIVREFQISYIDSIKKTYLNFNFNSKLFVWISILGLVVSIWTIFNSGSRGSLIGIFTGLMFTISILVYKREDLRRYLYGALAVFGTLVIAFILLINLIQSQRFEIKNTVLKSYIPEEVIASEELSFTFDKVVQDVGTNTNNEINNILSQLNFLKVFQEAERGSNSSLNMKSLSELIEENNYYPSENEIYCSNEMMLYFWATNRYSFRECTSVMKVVSIFGPGISYPFKSGFKINDREYAWDIAIKGFLSKPLFGVGPENFPILHYKYLDLSMSDDKPHLDRAHNRILHVLSTSGIFGGISLIALWSTIIFLLMKKIFSSKFYIFWIMVASAFISYAISSMFIFPVSSTYLQIVLIISLISKSSTLEDVSNTVENNEERFTKDSISVLTSIITFAVVFVLVRSFIYIPFETAKVTPPLGRPSSVIEIQENINKFPKLANYGRQELFYILIRDYDQMLSDANSQGNFAESYTSLIILIDQEYNEAINIEPDNFNIHFAAASLYLSLSKFEASNLDKVSLIVSEMERLSPNSVQTLEIKIRMALLRNDDVEAEKLIINWRESMPYQVKGFWDENLAIAKGELIPDVELNCKNEQYPSDKPQFDDSNLLYTNELAGGVVVGIKKEAPEDAAKVLPGTIVKMDYAGWLPTGCLFDSSFLPGMSPLSFLVGNNQAIPGIEESLITLKKGNIARIVIPPEKAYGPNGISGLIPPNSPLYFEVEILDVEVTGEKID